MKKTILIQCLALGMLLLLGTGCFQSTVNTVENQQKTMRPDAIRSEQLFTDNFCRDRIQVVSVDRAELPGNLIKIQVTLRSTRLGFWSEIWTWMTDENPYPIEYKFDWLDVNGMEVKTAGSVWLQLNLMPGETRRISSVSPNEKCRDFVLGLKEFGK